MSPLAYGPPPNRRRVLHHTVAAIRFDRTQDADDAPVSCSCGAVVSVRDYAAHIKTPATPAVNPSNGADSMPGQSKSAEGA